LTVLDSGKIQSGASGLVCPFTLTPLMIAGRTAQEYNQRKSRKGAFWEDRYFATAVCADHHLARCLVYIDLNMVRAGVVSHPGQWKVSGYHEIQSPPERYRVIDQSALCRLTQCDNQQTLQSAHRQWVTHALQAGDFRRNGTWTDSVAVGPQSYIEKVEAQLGTRAYHRKVEMQTEGTFVIREDVQLRR
jgi:hypothetical protein